DQIRHDLARAGYSLGEACFGARWVVELSKAGRLHQAPGSSQAEAWGAALRLADEADRLSPARKRPAPPHPPAQRALPLLPAAASGGRDAVRALAGLLRRLLPTDPRADALATLLPAVAVGPAVRRYVRMVLEVLARGGIVPAGSHPDNIPSALALRARGRE